MRFEGEWLTAEDGILRPVIAVDLPAAGGGWEPVSFLVDTGADRTVICHERATNLGLELWPADDFFLLGAGGVAAAARVRVDLRLIRETGEPVLFRGPFAAASDPTALDTNVLGRDVLGRLAVIVDRPAGVVCLLGGNHRYLIQSP